MSGSTDRVILLISVGGSAEPVAYSIERYCPAKIIFFASRASRPEIESRVRPLTSHRWQDQEIITTPDHQDLTVCVQALLDGLPVALANLGVSPDQLMVDYTGGTKTMSAALVLATIHLPVTYSYVGGTVRSREGLGQVLDGSEAVISTINPWDLLALDLRRRLAHQFNHAHFAEAAVTADLAVMRVGEHLRTLFSGLKDVCDGYARWHAFDYPGAASVLNRSVRRVIEWVRAARDESLMAFATAVKADCERLELMVPAFHSLTRGKQADAAAKRLLVTDLVAQAQRTCRLAGRPDDGVARLYSALEKLAKVALTDRGIENSNANVEQLPDILREDFAQRYRDPVTGQLRFGLDASYRVLAALGDPLGARYEENAAELRNVLGVRNSSLLVHGWSPVDAAVFERMLAVTLRFLRISSHDLPRLPHFPEA